jgi:hypothetical protein
MSWTLLGLRCIYHKLDDSRSGLTEEQCDEKREGI